MKNILCGVLILFGCIGVFAQEKTISQEEFEAIYKNSVEMWKGKSHRLTVTNESKAEGRTQTDFTSKSVIESASPTASRTIYETVFGSKNSKRELIRIGDKTYTRKDAEAWREGTFENEQTANKLTAAEDQAEARSEYKFLGTEKLNNQNAKVYAKIVRTKRLSPSTNQETMTVNTTKYWFADDGTILKSDMAMESRNGDKIFHSRSTQVWESDSNIKIESPKLN